MPQVRARSVALAATLLGAGTLPALAGPALAAPPQPPPPPPTNLLFSEYIEGTSNNKALEIFNGTGAAIDLGAEGYQVQMAFNGSSTPTLTIDLVGTVADGDVFVLAHASADPAILAQADQTNGAGWFNGDDAVLLVQGGGVVDSIGQVGFDPGTEWGSGLISTADNTLRRRASVSTGDTDPTDVFDPADTWEGFATNTFDGLGTHALGGGDTAPAVLATSPVDGSTSPVVPSAVEITYDEPVTVAAAAVGFTCSVSGAKTVTVATAGDAVTVTPSSPVVDGDTCTVTVPAGAVADADTVDPPDNPETDLSITFTVADPCAGPFTAIPVIQGSGAASPLAGTTVTTEGVVVSDDQGSANLNGFFLQDPAGDGDPATSDGLFVFAPSAPDVSVGDVVRVTGQVVEFNTLTEISNPTEVLTCGAAPVPPPAPVTLPEPVNDDLERFEGMRIAIDQPLTVQQNFFQGRFGQVTLAAGGRLFQPTNEFPAGSPQANALADENARRLLVLDDGMNAQNPNPIPYIGADNTLRAGDRVTGLVGVLDHGPINSNTAIRDYRLHPTEPPTFTRVNQRTPAPEEVGGNLKVASFNVLNFFTTLNARGANSPLELQRQTDKLVAAIIAIDADVIGVIEIENNGPVAMGALVDALNAAEGPGTYAAIADPASGVGTDAIKVGLIYQPARVVPVGPSASLALPATFERFPVAQRFQLVSNGEQATVVINHFKSKSCDGATGNDLDQGDGQGCFNARRVSQANALVGFVQQLAAADPDVLVIGDLNAYAKEDPIRVLRDAGLVDLIDVHVPDGYSYVFDGMSGYLDHALATPSAAAQVTDATEWHINADEPSVIDYNTEFKPQDLYAPTPYRSSDHDPVIVGLDLGACRFQDHAALRVRRLVADCSTATTIRVPDGWTLDGRGHTITAYDEPGDHFRGAVIANGGAVANVTNVTVRAYELADVCDTGADRLRGVLLDGASGSVTATRVLDLHQGTGSTCAEGVGIEARNAPFARGGRDKVVVITANEVRRSQHTGIVVNGSVSGSVSANVIEGSGPTAALAQRGVQIGFGGAALVILNSIANHTFPGADVACGLLVVSADTVGQNANRFTGNERNVCTSGPAFTP